MKTFADEIKKFRDLLVNKTNFAFTRFSDGELFVLQNKEVILGEDFYVTGAIKGHGIYTKEEQKEFLPEQHKDFRKLLIDAFLYDDESFYKGINCRCCNTRTDFVWQFRVMYDNKEDIQKGINGEFENLTWSNLFLNSNYKFYIENVVPLFSNFDVYIIVNEIADLTELPFYNNIQQDFRVGTNCMVNNIDLINTLPDYIQKNNINNSLFLFSAASLSNVATHACYKTNKNNIYLDIGSSLNPYMKGMEGWKYSRDYLTNYWFNNKNTIGERVCIW